MLSNREHELIWIGLPASFNLDNPLIVLVIYMLTGVKTLDLDLRIVRTFCVGWSYDRARCSSEKSGETVCVPLVVVLDTVH